MKIEEEKERPEIILYSNSVQLNITFFDFQFKFGKILPENKHITDASIYMSPEHTKVLYLLLKDQIEKYEDRFSEIIVPQNMLKIEKVEEKK